MLVLLNNLLVLLERLQHFPSKTRSGGTDSHEVNILASTPVVYLTDKAEAKRCKKRSREIRRDECSDVEAKAGRLWEDLAAASVRPARRNLLDLQSTSIKIKTSHSVAIT
jgi:hypothetical protein